MMRSDTIGGIAIQITDPKLGAGGQGQAAKATLQNDPSVTLVAKTLPHSAITERRTAALTSLGLAKLAPGLAAPLAYDVHAGALRHVAPFAPGEDVESDPPRSFAQCLEIAHHHACLWTLLEERGLAHGDIAPSNVRIAPDGAVSFIDFDNFFDRRGGAPAPEMAGQALVYAPELRRRRGVVNLRSDRFAHAVVLNMILLGRHPAEGLTEDPAEFAKIMSASKWPERRRKPEPDETPVAALGPKLPKLFDAAFSTWSRWRPSADQWRRALHDALQNTWIHRCGGAFVSTSPRQCPWCGEAPSAATAKTLSAASGQLTIELRSTGAHFKTILADGESILLGRSNLTAGDPTLSARHLKITRQGGRLQLRSIGRNGSWLFDNNQWSPLTATTISTSQVTELRLANTDITLKWR